MSAKVTQLTSTHNLVAEFERIDTRRAHQLLAMNHANRDISRSRVSQYAEAIKGGEWKVTGQPIQVSASGRLLDGQHRLEAVVMTGTPIIALVVSGLDDDIFDVIDCGKPRTPADALTVDGHIPARMASMMAAAAKMCLGYQAGGGGFLRSFKVDGTPNKVIREWIAGNEEFKICAAVCSDWQIEHKKSKPISDAQLLFHYYQQNLVDANAAEAFMRRVYTAVGCTTDAPEFKLRERLIECKLGYIDLSPAARDAIIIQTFNHVHSGRRMADGEYLRWSRRDQFPRYRG